MSNVYVSDQWGLIQKFTNTGGFIARWQTGDGRGAECIRPMGMTIGPDGLIYVSDVLVNAIQILDLDGNLVRRWGQEGRHPGFLLSPLGVAVDQEGRVYVADHHNMRMQIFTGTGELVAVWGKRGREPNQFVHRGFRQRSLPATLQTGSCGR